MKFNIKYTKELLVPICGQSISIAEVLRRLGLAQSGGNHSHIKSKIDQFQIDISHFLGRAANSVIGNFPEKLNAKEILVYDRLNGTREKVTKLRRALLELNVEHKCAVCNLPPFWNGQYLQLQIDHIDGNFLNNNFEKLRFICGNCHMQTETYGIKNSANYIPKEIINPTQIKPDKIIIINSTPSELNSNWRSAPRFDKRKVERPSKEELEKLVWEKPTSQLAKDFGVSDKAIEKWVKKYGIEKPKPGYWQKQKASTNK